MIEQYLWRISSRMLAQLFVRFLEAWVFFRETFQRCHFISRRAARVINSLNYLFPPLCNSTQMSIPLRSTQPKTTNCSEFNLKYTSDTFQLANLENFEFSDSWLSEQEPKCSRCRFCKKPYYWISCTISLLSSNSFLNPFMKSKFSKKNFFTHKTNLFLIDSKNLIWNIRHDVKYN